MSKPLKVLIPMGGAGTRLRPLTWSRPKPLVSLAGKTIIDHVVDVCRTAPNFNEVEFIFSINAQIEAQIREHMASFYPDMKVAFPIDNQMRGQSDAFWPAKDFLEGPLLVIFSDTIISSDFSFLSNEDSDGVIWVKPVPDPRRFGVTIVDEAGWISKLIEKPSEMQHNLAVVGCYYFRDSEALLSAIKEQIDRKLFLKGEFYLADAINILLQRGLRMRVEKVDLWLDAGTHEALLSTNHYLLENGSDYSGEPANLEDTTIIPPVFIHPEARVRSSVVGPHVSLGKDAVIQDSILKDSIIGDGTHITNSVLEASLIGHKVTVADKSGRVFLGDNSWAVS
jgi:glucose-1-phosphate thymidylyltransferase